MITPGGVFLLPGGLGPALARPLLPAAAAPILLATLIGFGAYMLWEILNWVRGNRSRLTPGQFRRRLIGGVLLVVELALWLLFDPLMEAHPPRERLLYMLCTVSILPILVLLSLREAAFVVRQYARWHGDLIREMRRPESRGDQEG